MEMTKTDQFVVCINDTDYSASLEARKIYLTLADDGARSRGMVRVVDESGEDHLYSARRFAPISLTKSAKVALGWAC